MKRRTDYTQYGCDISSLAGQTGNLEFFENPGPRVFGITYLDNISFSNQPVPEPSSWTLLLCGAGLVSMARFAGSKLRR